VKHLDQFSAVLLTSFFNVEIFFAIFIATLASVAHSRHTFLVRSIFFENEDQTTIKLLRTKG